MQELFNTKLALKHDTTDFYGMQELFNTKRALKHDTTDF